MARNDDDHDRGSYELFMRNHPDHEANIERIQRRIDRGNRPGGGTHHQRWPIGTWKAPYGTIGGRALQGVARGVAVVGTGVPKGAAKG